MIEVLEIEEVVLDNHEKTMPKFDSWVMEIPKEIIAAQHLADATLVTSTYQDGEIISTIIQPSTKIRAVSKRILEKNRPLYEELKQIGD